jgi:ParB-like chromosome segregation protein Spo0J
MVKLSDLKPHPYNKTVFRELTGNEYEAFKESVKQHGIQVRIEITSDNRILCGHQRIRALKELYGNDYDLADSKVWVRKDLESEDKSMTDILQRMRVIEDNQLRRHLNDGEKTMIYMEKKKLEEILAKIRYKETVGRPNKSVENLPPINSKNKVKSRDKASEGLGIT